MFEFMPENCFLYFCKVLCEIFKIHNFRLGRRKGERVRKGGNRRQMAGKPFLSFCLCSFCLLTLVFFVFFPFCLLSFAFCPQLDMLIKVYYSYKQLLGKTGNLGNLRRLEPRSKKQAYSKEDLAFTAFVDILSAIPSTSFVLLSVWEVEALSILATD